MLAAALLVLALQDSAAGLPGDEGPLRNDAWQPFSREAEEQLAAGDALFGLLTGEGRGPSDPDRAWTDVFESWRAALVLGQPGDTVAPRPVGDQAEQTSPWPDPDGTAERRAEGLEGAVLRRLRALPPAARRAWRERFSGLAREALDAAGRSAGELAEVERLHPGTLEAAAAAARLSDRAFEQGRPRQAEGWLARAAVHVRLAGDGEAEWAARLEARRAACRELIGALELPDPADEEWRSAADLRPISSFSLRNPRTRIRSRHHGPGQGVQPGLCFLVDGTAAVQAAERVFLREPERGGRVADFVPAHLIESAGWSTPDVNAFATEPPGWPLLPATDGEALVLVHGRASGLARNVLMCVDISHGPDPLAETSGTAVPLLRWALMENWRYEGDGPPQPGDLGLESPEFQPGPLVIGSQVIVQVRERSPDDSPDRIGGLRTESEIRSWVISIDLGTGRLLWKRLVAKGVPVASGMGGRFAVSTQAVSSAQALVALDGRVFAGTHLGVGALLDLVDGRIAWSLKNRRREADETGWSGQRPPVDAARGVVVWAPADGDHLYWLRVGNGDAGVLVHPPRAIGEAEVLLAGDADGALVLGRAGRERTASAWDARTGGRLDAPYFGPGEVFSGHGLASKTRLLFATDRGAVLLDRARDLFLMDYVPLRQDPGGVPGGMPGPPARGGGDLYARDDRIWVVGRDAVWILAAS